MKKYIFIAFCWCVLISGCEQCCTLTQEDINSFYSSYVEEWQRSAKDCFDKAEKIVFNQQDEIIDTHPDPRKCICKGSGIIVQGDGHTSQCPFHGKGSKLQDKK